MGLPRSDSQTPRVVDRIGIRQDLPAFALSALLMVAAFLALAGRVSAASRAEMTATPAPPADGSTLAVARAGGASLYDVTGKLVTALPRGAALTIIGRSPDRKWFYGSTTGGASGWVSARELVIFGVHNSPVREDITEPAAIIVQPTANPAKGIQAIVAGGSDALNVRAGPGVSFPVIGALQPGATAFALARNESADWVQIEQPNGFGWVSASFVDMQGDIRSLAVPAQIPVASAPSSIVAGAFGKLVFQDRSGGAIHVYDLTSGTLRVLTTGADPAISPDGQTVAFWRDSQTHDIYLIDIDGGNERRILSRSEAIRAPSWSPDGEMIVFSHVKGEKRCRDAGHGVCLPDSYPYDLLFPLVVSDRWGLARVDRNGGEFRDLPAEPSAFSPNWSRQGIFYAGMGIQVTQDVSDKNQNRRVLSEQRYQDPAVQPGGDRIVFHSLEKDHWDIFTAGVDGSRVVALTRPETTLVKPLPHNVAPTWSPDGQHIAFLSNRTGQWKLWLMRADGGAPRLLPIDVPITYNYQAEQVVSWGE